MHAPQYWTPLPPIFTKLKFFFRKCSSNCEHVWMCFFSSAFISWYSQAKRGLAALLHGTGKGLLPNMVRKNMVTSGVLSHCVLNISFESFILWVRHPPVTWFGEQSFENMTPPLETIQHIYAGQAVCVCLSVCLSV